MSKRTRYTVSFKESHKEDAVSTTVRVSISAYNGINNPTTELDAIEPAIRKMIGSTAIWKEDRGVSPKYGRVFKPTKMANYSSITGMAWIEIVKGW
jgi:hypothetical protein